MNIRLNPHAEQLLKDEMATGRFHSPEQVIERALESLRESMPSSCRRSRPSLETFRHFLDALAKGSEKIPGVPTSAFSRESIYQDHP
jgi:hypothetical protein